MSSSPRLTFAPKTFAAGGANTHILRSSDAVCVRYPLERLARVCPFFDGLVSVPRPPPPPHAIAAAAAASGVCPHAARMTAPVSPVVSNESEVSSEVSRCPHSMIDSDHPHSDSASVPASASDSSLSTTSNSTADDESTVIDLPVPWGGLQLCLELVDAHLSCPALGALTSPSSPISSSPSTASAATNLLRHGVQEHIDSMIETAHAFGLSFIGSQVYDAFAGQPVPAHGGASDPLWIFAVVAATGARDVLVPAAWNTLRPDYDIVRGSLGGKRLLRRYARDELRELYVVHHAWHYALQVYDEYMLDCEEWGVQASPGEGWARDVRHDGCPYPSVAMVAADARLRVKTHLYSKPRFPKQQSFASIVANLTDPVRLTDIIAPAMSACDTCVYADNGLLDKFVQAVQTQFVDTLATELAGLCLLAPK